MSNRPPFLISSQKNQGAEIVSLTYPHGTSPQPSALDLSALVLFTQKALDHQTQEIYLRLPYKSPLITIEYGNSPFLHQAQQIARQHSLDPGHPTATVLVKGHQIISSGANGSTYHDQYGCRRKELNIPTGQGYELCEGCHPKNHSEPTAIRAAAAAHKTHLLSEATAYLYGHWWCCQPCCAALEQAGITKVVFSLPWTQKFLEIDI